MFQPILPFLVYPLDNLHFFLTCHKWSGTQTKLPTPLEFIPAEFLLNIGKSPGNPVVKLAPPKGTINLTKGTKKNELRVSGEVEPFRKLDEQRNSLSSGRMQRNCCKVFRVHKLVKSMIRHNRNVSESWKTLPWKKFRRDLFRLQKRVYKAIQVGDKQKAKSLQKLILKSTAARRLAIRQVTQLNAGKKTAGIDKKASLTFEERLALSEELRAKSNNWKHQKLRSIPIPKKDGSTRLAKDTYYCRQSVAMSRKIREASQRTKQLSTPGVMDSGQGGRRTTRRNFCSKIYALRVME